MLLLGVETYSMIPTCAHHSVRCFMSPKAYRGCAFCGQLFGSASLSIHEKRCRSRPFGAAAPTDRRAATSRLEEPVGLRVTGLTGPLEESICLQPCCHCGRTFSADRIAIHERVCLSARPDPLPKEHDRGRKSPAHGRVKQLLQTSMCPWREQHATGVSFQRDEQDDMKGVAHFLVSNSPPRPATASSALCSKVHGDAAVHSTSTPTSPRILTRRVELPQPASRRAPGGGIDHWHCTSHGGGGLRRSLAAGKPSSGEGMRIMPCGSSGAPQQVRPQVSAASSMRIKQFTRTEAPQARPATCTASFSRSIPHCQELRLTRRISELARWQATEECGRGRRR